MSNSRDIPDESVATASLTGLEKGCRQTLPWDYVRVARHSTVRWTEALAPVIQPHLLLECSAISR